MLMIYNLQENIKIYNSKVKDDLLYIHGLLIIDSYDENYDTNIVKYNEVIIIFDLKRRIKLRYEKLHKIDGSKRELIDNKLYDYNENFVFIIDLKELVEKEIPDNCLQNIYYDIWREYYIFSGYSFTTVLNNLSIKVINVGTCYIFKINDKIYYLQNYENDTYYIKDLETSDILFRVIFNEKETNICENNIHIKYSYYFTDIKYYDNNLIFYHIHDNTYIKVNLSSRELHEENLNIILDINSGYLNDDNSSNNIISDVDINLEINLGQDIELNSDENSIDSTDEEYDDGEASLYDIDDSPSYDILNDNLSDSDDESSDYGNSDSNNNSDDDSGGEHIDDIYMDSNVEIINIRENKINLYPLGGDGAKIYFKKNNKNYIYDVEKGNLVYFKKNRSSNEFLITFISNSFPYSNICTDINYIEYENESYFILTNNDELEIYINENLQHEHIKEINDLEDDNKLILIGTEKDNILIPLNLLKYRSIFMKDLLISMDIDVENGFISEHLENIKLYYDFIINFDKIINDEYKIQNLYDLFRISNYMQDIDLECIAERILIYINENNISIEDSYKYLKLLHFSTCYRYSLILLYIIDKKYKRDVFLNMLIKDENNNFYRFISMDLLKTYDKYLLKVYH